MKNIKVEFLKDYVFSDNAKPYDCKKGDAISLSENTANILCNRKVCKVKKATKSNK